jgi:hypothetical protein
MEKICYAIVTSTRKLRHYFEAHTVKVLTNQPLNDIFGNRDSSGRISKWAMELSEHVVDFKKHNAIKSQILWQNGRSLASKFKDQSLSQHGSSVATELGAQ